MVLGVNGLRDFFKNFSKNRKSQPSERPLHKAICICRIGPRAPRENIACGFVQKEGPIGKTFKGISNSQKKV
jgi:hypothetical protein